MNEKSEIMDCRRCSENIENYAEGKLRDEDRLSFEAHIKSCNECALLFKLHQLAEKVISQEKNLSPGYFMTERILAGIDNHQNENKPVIISIFRPVLAAISVAAAIFAGVLIGNLHQVNGELRAPVELTYMNDTQIESIDLLSSE